MTEPLRPDSPLMGGLPRALIAQLCESDAPNPQERKRMDSAAKAMAALGGAAAMAEGACKPMAHRDQYFEWLRGVLATSAHFRLLAGALNAAPADRRAQRARQLLIDDARARGWVTDEQIALWRSGAGRWMSREDMENGDGND